MCMSFPVTSFSDPTNGFLLSTLLNDPFEIEVGIIIKWCTMRVKKREKIGERSRKSERFHLRTPTFGCLVPKGGDAETS